MNEWSKENYLSFLEEKSTGAVYFYTPMCGTCMVASKMLMVVAEIDRKLVIGKLNLNFVPEIAKDLTIESVPCLVLIRDGEVLDMIYAFHSVPFLLDKIKSTLT
ncbi:MAG: thioredoxin family protein [Bacillota bacterium]|nr:thioredoxin family protein [Bacillota bacterium]